MSADTEVSHALLISTRDGAFPASDEVLTAELESTGLAASLQLLRDAKSEIETDLPVVGRQSSSDLDTWISQAKHLQQEIERSKAVAREIVQQHEEVERLSSRAQDARAKLQLLQHETSFNHVLTSCLRQISSVNSSLDQAESDLASGRLLKLAASLDHLHQQSSQSANGTAAMIIDDRYSEIRRAVVEGLANAANSMIEFHDSLGHQAVKVDHGKHASLGVSLGELLDMLGKLDALEDLQRTCAKTFYRRLCLLALSPSSTEAEFSVDGTSHCLMLYKKQGLKNEQAALDCLTSIFQFLRTQIPAELGYAMGTTLSQELVDTLITNWLTPSIPLIPAALLEYCKGQAGVTQLMEYLGSSQWPGQEALALWIETIPQTWLERRCIASLDAVRTVLMAPRGPSIEVQRVERQRVDDEDIAFAGNEIIESKAGQPQAEKPGTMAWTETTNGDEEDLSAWDLDEDINSNEIAQGSEHGSSHDIGSEPSGSHERENGFPEQGEVTLSETYQITDLPDQLLDIIRQTHEDVTQLKGPGYANLISRTSPAALIQLPHQLLAMFRAIAPARYSSNMTDGNMRLYNDCVYVVEKLRDLAKQKSWNQLPQECEMLEKFAAAAYTREMDSQRTVLGDLMDGAQGFVGCTSFPYSAECEKAVSSTVDRLRAMHREWSRFLSRSVLLQSVGSLLSTVIEKMMQDIEDMEDISDAESQRLALFCDGFSALEDLFLAEGQPRENDGGASERVPLTAVYVPHWLRFQYLSNILESSLVDIRYLWTEGELELEFTAEEVIDLIEALFSESTHRRNAIAEIRRDRT